MKQTRRWLTLMLVVTLMLGLAVGVSAEEGEQSPQYGIVYRWLNRDGEGILYEEEHFNDGFHMTPGERYEVVFYLAKRNSQEEAWEAIKQISPKDLVYDGDLVSVVPFDLWEDYEKNTYEEATNFCYFSGLQWDTDIEFSYSDEELGVTAYLWGTVRRHEAGFYSSPEMSNDTYITSVEVKPNDEVCEFYFGYDSEYWDVNTISISDEHGGVASLEAVDGKEDLWKVSFTTDHNEFHVFVEGTTVHENEDGTKEYGEFGSGIWCYAGMDTSPYLSFAWLDQDENGWFEQEHKDNRGWEFDAWEHVWHIYYLNVWNEEKGDWDRTPIHPDDLTTNEHLSILSFRDFPEDEQQSVRNDQANGDYFCRVQSTCENTSLNKTGTLSYTYGDTELTMKVNIHRNTDGFYSSAGMSNSTYIKEVVLDPFSSEDRVFYFGFDTSGEWKIDTETVTLWAHADKASIEQVEGKNNVWRITIPAKYVQNSIHEDFNIGVQFNVYREDENGDKFDVQEWRPQIYCHAEEHDERVAYLNIDDKEYNVFTRDGEAFFMADYVDGKWEDKDEEGNVIDSGDIWRVGLTSLPDGVSYDPFTNTLTLNNAHIKRLEAGYRWYDEERNEEGHNLPKQELTIQLIGENSIVCEYDRAVVFREEVNAIFTGEGSLLVKSVNSEENTYEHYLYNENGEIRDEEGNHLFIEVPFRYPAISIEGGATLTVAGSADVTVEIGGTALEPRWEWNEELGYETVVQTRQAHLCAIQGGCNSLVLKESGSLTTKLPEGARDNGPQAAEDEIWDDEQTPGGYSGLDNFLNITIQDNAVLNTSSLRIADRWEWTEEDGDHLVEAGSYTQSGGTVNIVALGRLSVVENWQWDEENQTDVMVGYVDHAHYNGFEADAANVTITGGTLNITCNATKEELEESAWSETMRVNAGELQVSGGEININLNIGFGLRIGGKLNLSDGSININNTGDYDANICFDYGSEENTITGGSLTFNSNGGWSCATFDAPVTVSGGTVSINCDSVELHSDLTVNGGNVHFSSEQIHQDGLLKVTDGAVEIDSATMYLHYNSKIHMAGGEFTANFINDTVEYMETGLHTERGSEIIVEDGSFNVNSKNYISAMDLYDKLTQTGGSINLVATATEDWEIAMGTDDKGNVWPVSYRGLFSVGRLDLSGGSFTSKGNFGACVNYDYGDILNPEEWPALEYGGLFVSGDANVSFIGEYRGVQIVAPAEISGGYVYTRGGEYASLGVFNGGWTEEPKDEEGNRLTDEEGNLISIEVPNKTYLKITGGNILIETIVDEGVTAFGLVANNAPVNISGAQVEIAAPVVFYGINSKLEGDYYLVSYNSGKELELLEEKWVSVDEEGNPALDLEGNPVLDENGNPIVEYYYYYEEDNALDPELKEFDYATCVILYPDNKCGDDAYWEVKDGTLIISGTGDMYSYDMEGISPAQWKNMTPWYYLKKHITEVVVSEGITSMPDFVFAHLDKLTKVTIPSSVTQIGTYAFNRSFALAEFVLSEENETFDCYYGNTLVSGDELRFVAYKTSGEYVVPECVKVVATDVGGNTQIEKLTFAGEVTTIQDYAFCGNKALTVMELPASITSIGDGVFSESTGTYRVYHNSEAANYVENKELSVAYIHTGDTDGEPEVENYEDSTCTKTGSYDSVVYCTECDAELSRVTEEIALKTHTPGDAVKENINESTCSEEGSYDSVVYCTGCGNELSRTSKKIDLKAHVFGEWKQTVPPTEETEGTEVRTCVCGKTETRTVAKLTPSHTHSYTAVVTAPTCTEKGYTTYTCSCGASYTADETAVIAHSFGEWKTTVLPTVAAKGESQRVCEHCGLVEKTELAQLAEHFTDVVEKDWFCNAVAWAAANEITTGTSETTFSPKQDCTRAQVVTFLWRAAGSPMPTITENPFTDVVEGQFYYNAVLWAVENNITTGMTATTFGTKEPCTRGQVVTFLWRTAGEPAATSTEHDFTDVKDGAFYYKAMLWAVEKEITTGVTATTFCPGTTCNRATIVTFLYRYTNQ